MPWERDVSGKTVDDEWRGRSQVAALRFALQYLGGPFAVRLTNGFVVKPVKCCGRLVKVATRVLGDGAGFDVLAAWTRTIVVGASDQQAAGDERWAVGKVAVRSSACAALAQQIRFVVAVDAVAEVVANRLTVNASSVAAAKRVLRA